MIDGFLKGRKTNFAVIPAKAGIQQQGKNRPSLDPGFHRGDDFLQDHQL